MKEVVIFIEQLLHAVPHSPALLSNPAVAMLRGIEIMTAPSKWFLKRLQKKDEARFGN
jgi:hypothetical protein